ncbi:MAG: GDP-mannose 4,6-dehydratase [Actinobacteria bacterium]|nr:GDP-mannose 4,6-dehydratase [Actinomycetota bacterium]
MKVLITGITGFAGSHLARYLRSQGVEIAGIDLQLPAEPDEAEVASLTNCCNLADTPALLEILKREAPGAIVHLAARAQVAGAWEDAAAIMEANIVCTQSLMQAVHEAAPGTRVLLISSSEVYGKVADGRMPITEEHPLRPDNPYSVSKAAQELIGLQYFYTFGAPVIIARPFNHIGPGQKGNFVVPAFAGQIAAIENGLREPVIRAGNLDSQRDFTDVRDIVRAYWLLLTEGQPGQVYNIASGRVHRIREILDKLIELARIKPRIENVPELMRPSDTPVVIGDATKLKSLGPWEASVPLADSLRDALDFWRRQSQESQA